MEILTPADSGPPHRPAATSSRHKRLRPCDLEALLRLRDQGPLTIPMAYDCGHSHNETNGHGMNRLVGATLAVFHDWDPVEDDALWAITSKGRRVLHTMETSQS